MKKLFIALTALVVIQIGFSIFTFLRLQGVMRINDNQGGIMVQMLGTPTLQNELRSIIQQQNDKK